MGVRWTVKLFGEAERDLAVLDRNVQEAALDTLQELAEDPFLEGSMPLRGHRDYYRVRFHRDRYRLIYRVSKSQRKVVVTRISRRDSKTYVGYDRDR